MDDMTAEFLELLDEYTPRDIVQRYVSIKELETAKELIAQNVSPADAYRLVEAMTDYGSEEENPEAWERSAKALEKLAASKDFEDMISW